jgi:hypothetical protein
VAVDSATGDVFIADTDNNLVEEVNSSGTLSIFAGTGTSGPPTAGTATSSDLNAPGQVAVDPVTGDVFIVDSGNNVVEEVNSSGTLSIVAGNGTSGTVTAGPATSSDLSPSAVAVDPATGGLFISTGGNVVEVTPAGQLSVVAGNNSGGPTTPGPATGTGLGPDGLAVDSTGDLFIADGSYAVEVTPAGQLSIVAGNGSSGAPAPGPATSSPLSYVTGVALDGNGDLFILDNGNTDVEEVTPSGTLSVVAGVGHYGQDIPGPATSSPLWDPNGDAVDPLTGDLFITDAVNEDIDQVTLTGSTSQTVSFSSTAPTAAQFGSGATYSVAASATSSLPVTFTVDPTSSSVCSVSGSTVSFTAPGTCTIDADQYGNATYAPGDAQQSFTIAPAPDDQTVSFTSTAPTGAEAGGSYTVAASASTGLPVKLTIDPTTVGECSISGTTVTFTSIGFCVIDANQAGNATYNPAPLAQQSVAIAVGPSSITFASTAPTAAVVGGSYTVSASANSGLPVTLTIDYSTRNACSISVNTVSFIKNGTCTIDANAEGDASFTAAPQAQQSFTVSGSGQAIAFTSAAPTAATVGGSYSVSASAGSGLPVAFTLSGSSGVCSLSGTTVRFVGIGTCTIDANQAGNANYPAAPQVQQSFSIAAGAQTISFTSTAPTAAKVGGTYKVAASASTGLPVTLTIDSSVGTECSLSGTTVRFTGAGRCVIDANQAGNANYTEARAQQSFKIATVAAKGLSVSAKTKAGKLLVSGKLKLPNGVTAGEACGGTVTATALKGTKTLAKGSGTVNHKTCGYSIKLSGAKRATSLSVKFEGNNVLVALTTKHKLG